MSLLQGKRGFFEKKPGKKLYLIFPSVWDSVPSAEK